MRTRPESLWPLRRSCAGDRNDRSGAEAVTQGDTLMITGHRFTAVEQLLLDELSGGALLTLDRNGLAWLNGRQVRTESLSTLKKQGMVSLTNKSLPVNARHNGYRLSELGRQHWFSRRLSASPT